MKIPPIVLTCSWEGVWKTGNIFKTMFTRQNIIGILFFVFLNYFVFVNKFTKVSVNAVGNCRTWIVDRVHPLEMLRVLSDWLLIGPEININTYQMSFQTSSTN